MIQNNIQLFSDWYFKKKKVKRIDYRQVVCYDNPKIFIEKISAWGAAYYFAFRDNPFDKSYQGMTFTFIATLNANLLGLSKIEGYNKLYESSDEMTQFMSNNYIPFLVSLLYGDDLDLYKISRNEFMANAKIPFKKEFNSWLINSRNFTKGTAMSYCTYVKGINDTIMFDLNYPNIFFRIINKLVDEDLFHKLIWFLKNTVKSLKNKNMQSNLKKYNAGLQHYIIFLEQKFFSNVSNDSGTSLSID